MTHTNDAQCRPVRLDQYVNHDPPAYIRGPASISTTTSDPRPVFEARLVFKARLVFEEIWYLFILHLAASSIPYFSQKMGN